MDDPYESSGFGWIALIGLGFAIGFALSKLNVLTENNATPFCTWTSMVAASLVAFADGLGDGTFVTITGKLALLVILWFVFGLVFTLGVAMGMEKASK